MGSQSCLWVPGEQSPPPTATPVTTPVVTIDIVSVIMDNIM